MFAYTRAASQDLSHRIDPILFTCSYAEHLFGEMLHVRPDPFLGLEVYG